MSNQIKTKWDLTPLLESDNDPNIKQILKENEKKYYKFIEKWRDRKDYLKNPKVLREALDELEELGSKYGLTNGVGYYFYLRSAQDSENNDVRKMNAELDDLYNKISNDLEFFVIRLSTIDKTTQKLFLESEFLTPYKHYLFKLFRDAKYILSEKEEKILTLLSKPAFGDWTSMLSDFLSKAVLKVEVSEGRVEDYTLEEAVTTASEHKNPTVRSSAAQAIQELLEDNEDVAERELNAVLYTKKVTDQLRGYEKPNSARLLIDNIDLEVVEAMTEVVTDSFDISKRYYEFKAKLFDVEKLAYFERSLKYGEVDKDYEFEQAVDLIGNSFSEVDKEFGDFVNMYAKTGRFDVYPTKGKRAGAFCADYNKNVPVYVFLNHTKKIADVLTIAHEMGHAINSELTLRNQNSFYSGTSLATAEVASTFFETLVNDKLYQNLNDEQRLSMMIEDLDSDIGTIIRQVACYRFELELHKAFRKQKFLSKEVIGKLFVNYMHDYMGDFVDLEKMGHLGWIYWSHIRRFFYVYSYSNGALIAQAMKSRLDKDKNFVKDVKTFLSAGTSKSPKDVFTDMGIDITKKDFWEDGINVTRNKFKELENLATKLGKIK